jgi:hypothetical protein
LDVNSFLTGRRGVSLLFTDYRDPILEDAFIKHDMKRPLVASSPLRGGDRGEVSSKGF